MTCFDSDPEGWLGFGEWNSSDLPEGEFTTRLYRIVGETQFTPYNWLDDPTHLTSELVDRFSTLDQRLASKILYTYRF